jgi:hypothetical protein
MIGWSSCRFTVFPQRRGFDRLPREVHAQNAIAVPHLDKPVINPNSKPGDVDRGAFGFLLADDLTKPSGRLDEVKTAPPFCLEHAMPPSPGECRTVGGLLVKLRSEDSRTGAHVASTSRAQTEPMSQKDRRVARGLEVNWHVVLLHDGWLSGSSCNSNFASRVRIAESSKTLGLRSERCLRGPFDLGNQSHLLERSGIDALRMKVQTFSRYCGKTSIHATKCSVFAVRKRDHPELGWDQASCGEPMPGIDKREISSIESYSGQLRW